MLKTFLGDFIKGDRLQKYLCVYVCVCREGERERGGRDSLVSYDILLYFYNTLITQTHDKTNFHTSSLSQP